MLTAPSVSRFFSSLQAYLNHIGERERERKIIALSRVKLVDCDDTFSFFFFLLFVFQDSGSCLSSTRLVETKEGRREETNDKRTCAEWEKRCLDHFIVFSDR